MVTNEVKHTYGLVDYIFITLFDISIALWICIKNIGIENVDIRVLYIIAASLFIHLLNFHIINIIENPLRGLSLLKFISVTLLFGLPIASFFLSLFVGQLSLSLITVLFLFIMMYSTWLRYYIILNSLCIGIIRTINFFLGFSISPEFVSLIGTKNFIISGILLGTYIGISDFLWRYSKIRLTLLEAFIFFLLLVLWEIYGYIFMPISTLSKGGIILVLVYWSVVFILWKKRNKPRYIFEIGNAAVLFIEVLISELFNIKDINFLLLFILGWIIYSFLIKSAILRDKI